jgi:hypothetical protein
MNKPFEYYQDYLSFIENAVVEILIHDRMFSETAEIVKKNNLPDFKKTGIDPSNHSWVSPFRRCRF